MDSAPLDGCCSETSPIQILSEFAEERRTRRTRAGSQKRDSEARRTSNRILMLGRLRELALYRAEVLQHHGFEVTAPANEAEAIAAIRQANFDVAIVSYTLSDVSVRQFVDLIRQYRPDCPLLAISQSAQYDRLIEPDSVVVGDKGPAELLTAIRKLLKRQ